MEIRRWSRFGLAVSLSAILLGSLAPTGLAGSSSVNNGEEPSSTGTTNFGQSNETPALTPAQASEVAQNTLNEISAAIENGDSNIINQLEALLSGTSLSVSDLQTAMNAIQALLDQRDEGQATLSSRRPANSSIARTTLRTTILEYGGTAETADFTIELLNNLEIVNASSQATSIAALALTMQGLITGDIVENNRILDSIEAFNVLINSLSTEQLIIASKDPQIQSIKALLEGLSGAVTAR